MTQVPSVTGIVWGVAIHEVGVGGGAGSSTSASLILPFWAWKGQEDLRLFLQPQLYPCHGTCVMNVRLLTSTVCWDLC